ncbi:hypothetical protein [Flavobacterium ginsengisoli]|uniref:hypothetical protein n=1 Tax=Flavobacterium ginsengisoli TaxID=871694 RepID=UPI0024158F12|nr:hypothetical protein [Flavobacterium ginsengisoli]
MNAKIFTLIASLFILGNQGYSQKDKTFNIKKQLDYCAEQASKTLQVIPNDGTSPRTVSNGSKEWKFVDYKDWTSGFWPENYGFYMKRQKIKNGKKKPINLLVS